jgi:hypothetical protein
VNVKLLSSGYWHVRFSTNRFAQWPKWKECNSDDVFCGIGEHEQLAKQANDAVAAFLREEPPRGREASRG